MPFGVCNVLTADCSRSSELTPVLASMACTVLNCLVALFTASSAAMHSVNNGLFTELIAAAEIPTSMLTRSTMQSSTRATMLEGDQEALGEMSASSIGSCRSTRSCTSSMHWLTTTTAGMGVGFGVPCGMAGVGPRLAGTPTESPS